MSGYTYKNIKDFCNCITFAFIENRKGSHDQQMNNPLVTEYLHNHIDFELSNVGYLLGFLPHRSIEYLQNKTFLEIGAGQDFGVSLVLADLGLKQVIIVDPFLAEWNDTYHPKLYRELLEQASKKFPQVNFKSIKEVIHNNSHNAEKLICIKSGLEHLPQIQDDMVDVSFSNAVFEHFVYPKEAVKELARITKKGGLGFHQIDLRDHRDYDKPLEFLTFPKKMFQCMSKLNHAHFGNRLRYSEYNQLFENYGFEVEFKPDSVADDSYLDQILKKAIKKYRKMPKEEVGTLGGRFFLRK